MNQSMHVGAFLDGPAAQMFDELENSGGSMGRSRVSVATDFGFFRGDPTLSPRAPTCSVPAVDPPSSFLALTRAAIDSKPHQIGKSENRNGGFGTFLRVFYASLERRRQASPSVAAVAFGGSDDEWASLQVRYTTVKGCMRAVGIDSFFTILRR